MADEELSPDLEDLNAQIEKSAGVDEETKIRFLLLMLFLTRAMSLKILKARLWKSGAALAGVAAKTKESMMMKNPRRRSFFRFRGR